MTKFRWTLKVTYPDGSSKTAPFTTKKQAEVISDFVKEHYPDYKPEIIRNK